MGPFRLVQRITFSNEALSNLAAAWGCGLLRNKIRLCIAHVEASSHVAISCSGMYRIERRDTFCVVLGRMSLADSKSTLVAKGMADGN